MRPATQAALASTLCVLLFSGGYAVGRSVQAPGRYQLREATVRSQQMRKELLLLDTATGQTYRHLFWTTRDGE